MARDFIRQIQQLRKDHDLEENDRIQVAWSPVADRGAEVEAALQEWQEAILAETRSTVISQGAEESAKSVLVGDVEVRVAIRK